MKTSIQPTEAMINAANAVFAAMALVETVRPIIIGIQTKLLENGKYKYAPKWSERARGEEEYITNPKLSYLMTDEDSQKYFKTLGEEIKKAGFDTEEGYCPLLIAEHELISAKRTLIVEMEPIMMPIAGLTYEKVSTSKGCVKNIDELVELTLKLLAPYVGSKAVA